MTVRIRRFRDRMESWWEGRSDRQRSLLVWLLPQIAMWLLVLIDWTRYMSGGDMDTFEFRPLLYRVSVAMLGAVLLKEFVQRRWTVADLGWIFLITGTGLLIARTVVRKGPQPVDDWESFLHLAMMDVGAIVLIVGLVIVVVRATVLRKGQEDES